MADRRGISGRALARAGNISGAVPFILYYNSSTSTGTTNTDRVIHSAEFPFRVVRAWFSLTEAAAGDSEDVKLTDGTNDITDTADYSAGSDNDNYEFSSYDDAHSTINKGESLRIVKTATTAVTSFHMFIMCVRV
jgi:hypothetical protein